MDTQALIETNLLVKHLSGSHAYGMSTPQSDVDYRGIYFADQKSTRTPFFVTRHISDETEEDTSYLELNHFMKLVTDCNPNVVETLWVAEKDIILSSAEYQHIRAHRDALLSKKAAFTFSGYALAQLKRIKGHNKWINRADAGIDKLRGLYAAGSLSIEWLEMNFDRQTIEKVVGDITVVSPSGTTDMDPHLRDSDISLITTTPPRQVDYLTLVQNFTEAQLFKLDVSTIRDGWILYPYGGDIYGLYQCDGYTTFNANGSLNPFKVEQMDSSPFADESGEFRKSPQYLVKYNKSEYTTALDAHKNYWSWKNNRNKARGAQEEQFGFDTKHATHLVRLLRMGTEILETGQVIVARPDASELLDIRAGKWSYDEVVDYATAADNRIRTELYRTSSLRKAPDIDVAARVLMEVQDMCWSRRR